MNEKGGGREVFVGERLKSKVENCFHFVMAKKHTGGGAYLQISCGIYFSEGVGGVPNLYSKKLTGRLSHIFCCDFSFAIFNHSS